MEIFILFLRQKELLLSTSLVELTKYFPSLRGFFFNNNGDTLMLFIILTLLTTCGPPVVEPPVQ